MDMGGPHGPLPTRSAIRFTLTSDLDVTRGISQDSNSVTDSEMELVVSNCSLLYFKLYLSSRKL